MKKKKVSQEWKKLVLKKSKNKKLNKKKKKRSKKGQERFEKDKKSLIAIVLILIIFNIIAFSSLKPNITGNVVLEGNVSTGETPVQEEASQTPSSEPIPELQPAPEPEPAPDSEPEPTPQLEPEPAPEPIKTENITIAGWNFGFFNQTKSSNLTILETLKKIIKKYDIILIQQITDEEAFPTLCEELSNYECEASSFSSINSSNEQYGIIYKENLDLDDFDDFNPDEQEKWKRPPLRTKFNFENDEIILYNMHTDVKKTQEELELLENLIEDLDDIEEDKIIILGNLNADCSYYSAESEFKTSWTWIIKDDEDTTSTSDNCAFDRIIMNDLAEKNYVDDGIHKTNITADISPHYLIWVEIEVETK